MAIVVIDPGHGGTETVGGSSPNNATGPNGLKEKSVLLEIATCLGQQFSDNHQVTLTRDTDVNLSLGDRAKVAMDSTARVMISLHFNGFNGSAQGTETFVHPSWTNESDRLASCVQNSVLDATGLGDRKVKKKNLGVLKPSNHYVGTAAALVELSFMDVPAEAQRLESANYRNRLAKAVMHGVDLYLSDQNAWGNVHYTPQDLSVWTRMSRFVRNVFSSDGLEH